MHALKRSAWHSLHAIVSSPAAVMAAASCALLLGSSHYRVGGYFEGGGEPRAIRFVKAPPTPQVLAAPTLLVGLKPSVSWLRRASQSGEIDYHEVASCEGPRLRSDSGKRSRPNAAVDYHEIGSCEADPARVGEGIVAEVELPEVCHEEDDAFTAGWILTPFAETSDESALSSTVPPRRLVHELVGFDPLAALGAESSPVAAEQRGGAFAAFLARQEDNATSGDSALREVNLRIRPGETVSQLLDSAGIMPAEVGRWLKAADAVYDMNRVYAGQALSFTLDTRSSQIEHLALEIDDREILIGKREQDRFVVKREKIPYTVRQRTVEGPIASSLYMAATSRGVPDRVISEMAEILGWELDFSRGVHAGATFRVVYEELVRLDGTGTAAGRVLAVEVANPGTRYEGFYFALTDDAPGGYYRRDGEALGRYFLRYPVEFSRISSTFSERRFHPVLKRNRPHYGVDFAAPTGTPIRAIGSGKITRAGWHGGNGRFVKIRHDDTYESGYAHLSRIAPGIKAGTFVRKGQVIGYVGATGLATGPHLHFALYRNTGYVDPLSADLPRAKPLAGSELAQFRATVQEIDRAYARARGQDDRLASIPAADRSR
jgi:murein DD-endopeptidase MepM/ murein hydrolase activator NlpD